MYGGTFNPPHMGHLAAAESCIKRLRLDKLLLVPAGVPPHKDMEPGSPNPEQRLEMVRLAAQLVPGAQVCTIELERAGKSYTVDTMEQLRRMYPEDDLWLVMGTDMLRTFDTWRDPERILACCRLAALPRLPGEMEEVQRHARRLRRKLGAHIDIVPHEPVPVSSTMIRQGSCPELIPPAVAEYIRKQGLYHAYTE